MMKLSTKTTYAIKALADLAKTSEEGPSRLGDIAERQNIPLPYLEQIFSKLKNAGVVQSSRGPQGGYQLTKIPRQLPLYEVVVALEGPLEPVLCSQPELQSNHCHQVEGCFSRHFCNELDGAVARVLQKNTLGSMLGEKEKI